MTQLIAVLKEDHTFVAEDGCAGIWKTGDIIPIQCGSGVLDYVRKGVMVPAALENHFHVIPLVNLSLFLDDGKTRIPVNHDRLFGL